MPPAGQYLLSYVGFSSEKPLLVVQANDQLQNFWPLDTTLTLRVDTTQRHCVGWRDIATGQRFICPDHHAVDSKYEQCPACQKRTGFNPAFYHAASVSPQQQARNGQPHILYLAHFGDNVIKVGISHAGRGHGRLIEQGARSALILDTFPTANIARHYEAKIAAMSAIAETVLLNKKIAALTRPYDQAAIATTLLQTRRTIETTLGITFADNHVLSFDTIYFPHLQPDLTEAYNLDSQRQLSGHIIGMVGSLLFCQYDDAVTFLSVKKYTGYRITINNDQTAPSLPARQTSLF